MSKLTTAVKQIRSDRSAFAASIIQHFFKWLPDELYLKLLFCFKMGYKLNLKNPKTFNEKLQWLKLYNRKPEYTTMVDKYAVKQYVANIIGEEYIIPTLGVWDRFDDIDFSKLPQQFVLKTTHGGGGGGVIICRDKTTFNKEEARQKLEASMRGDIYKSLREWPYKNVPKRIIAEKFMAPLKSAIPKDLLDYKFFCFKGEPKFLYVSESRNHKMAFFNLDWTPTDFGRDDYEHFAEMPPKPADFDEMIEIVRRLAKDKPHVRVDLYNVENNTYFGELTFYTGSGFIPFNPKEFDGKLGDLLTLPNVIGGGKYLITNGIIKEFKPEYDELKDYKFFCFNGEPKFCQVIAGRETDNTTIDWYDLEWNLQNFQEPKQYAHSEKVHEKPSKFDDMVRFAKHLSSGKPFLRVDFYCINTQVFFGELTFFPTSGFGHFEPEEMAVTIGNYLELE